MLSWIKANPIVTGLIALGIVVFIIAGFSFLSRENQREEENLKSQGATEERSRTHEESLNVVRNANQPVTNNELRAECLRNNRNPAAC